MGKQHSGGVLIVGVPLIPPPHGTAIAMTLMALVQRHETAQARA
jgi:hypothetical protein